jgi:hypothetical protein
MNRLLTLSEMAAKLNRTAKTFKRHVDALGIPHVRLGSSLMFDPVAVLNHLAAQREAKREKRSVGRRTVKKAPSSRFAERLGI